MTAKLIDGKATATAIRKQIKHRVEEMIRAGEPVPGLATVLVGNDPGSEIYVRMKHRMCKRLGIYSVDNRLPAEASQEEVEGLVDALNRDERISGILVQLPLPAGLNEERVLSRISLQKDVDGFHPINIGRLAQKGRKPLLEPCTPAGVIRLLRDELPTLEGLHAVVLGRSNIVGMPVALMLLRENATVTVCHSRSRNLPDICRAADILVAAVGQPEMVRGDWIKPGAVVIDVGINRVDDPSQDSGYRLVGDVAFEEAMQVAGAVTPVPGGVGPMTIAMLMTNTLRAAQMS
ncbi:MAG: bifunctional methylenetetrahydrofolate dehydrogenase/methenyltetrahydrofolate cyclohydrolase FolD [Anaerolineaceae bacterium]|nr:bifunctional methylenetetrahydrofolate dehydrogenase/methenyltetrahydrofolate cyclohydrolase FolD [Anaerolineaceae bacterium]